MSNGQLSDRAAILLCLINDHTERGEDGKLTGFWVPRASRYGQTCPMLGGRIYVSGSGDAGALRALERRGLTRRREVSAYSYSVTEDGILHIERCLRETGRLDELREIVRKHDDVMMGKGTPDLDDDGTTPAT